MNATPPPTPTRARRLLAVVERLAVGHFAGYPIAFLWAVAAIPLTIHLSARALDAIGDVDRIGQYVVRRLAWPAGFAFLLAHLAPIPWIVAADPKRGLRRTFFMLGALAAAGVVFGAASWLWLFLRG